MRNFKTLIGIVVLRYTNDLWYNSNLNIFAQFTNWFSSHAIIDKFLRNDFYCFVVVGIEKMEINTKGSGTVGKAVTSDTRRPGLEYSHHQFLRSNNSLLY